MYVLCNNSTSTLQALWLRALALLDFSCLRAAHFLPGDRLEGRTCPKISIWSGR